jgi:putative nucleotidyltransferase with HDIG domain
MNDILKINPLPETTKKGRLLVVDDNKHTLRFLSMILDNLGYEVISAQDLNSAFEKMSFSYFVLALVDIQMPEGNGIELLEMIVKQYPDTAIIMMSGLGEIETAITTVKMGAYDYISKPFSRDVLQSRVELALEKRELIIENRNYHLNLEHLAEERTLALKNALSKIEHIYDTTIKTLGAALDLRDSETENHSIRVAEYVLKLAMACGIHNEDQLQDIKWGAYLHDIGKIGITDTILLKPGKLSAAEKSVIETHPELGYRLLKKIQFLEGAAELVFNHHESYDGTGYPRGLTGQDIPLSARLFAVADTMDAMTSDRPYRKALSYKAVCKELLRLSGVQFDPQVVEVFLSIPESEWRII